MSDCPRCNNKLDRFCADGGVSWQCPECGGLLATLPFLRRRLSVEAANRIWQTARESEPESSSRECPFCGKDMVRVQTEFDGHDIELDACLRCQAFWFDKGELEALPEAPPPPPPETAPELSPETKEKLVAAQMQFIQERAEMDPELGASTDDATSGLPLPESFPWATLFISVVSVVAWVTAPLATCGSYPRSDRTFWLMLLVLGRQSWVFGRGAEVELGGIRLLALWAASALVAGVVHVVAGEELVLLGLSLAIESHFGILVWLALAFPTARAASWGRGVSSMRFSRYWIPLPFFAVMWGLICVFLPLWLNLANQRGAFPAISAVAAVAFVFHRFVKK